MDGLGRRRARPSPGSSAPPTIASPLDKALPTPGRRPGAASRAWTKKDDGRRRTTPKDEKQEAARVAVDRRSSSTCRAPTRPRPCAYRGRPRRHHEGRRGDRERARSWSRATGSRPWAPPSVAVPAGARSGRTAGRTHASPAWLHRRARPPALLDARHLPAAALEVRWPTWPTASPPRTTRRPARHEAFGQSEMVEAGLMTGPAHLLDRLHPVRRRQRRPRDHQEPGRRAPARARA